MGVLLYGILLTSLGFRRVQLENSMSLNTSRRVDEVA